MVAGRWQGHHRRTSRPESVRVAGLTCSRLHSSDAVLAIIAFSCSRSVRLEQCSCSRSVIVCSHSSRCACNHPPVLTIGENEIRHARRVRHGVHLSPRPQGRRNGSLSDGSERGRQRFVCRTGGPSSKDYVRCTPDSLRHS